MATVTTPPYKVSLFFSNRSNTGWSETLWLNTPVARTFANAQAGLTAFVKDRMALACTDTYFIAARVSDPTSKNHAELYGPNDLGLTLPNGSYVPDQSGTLDTYSLPAELCLLLRLEDGLANRSYYRIHGIPDWIYRGSGPGEGLILMGVNWGAAYATFVSDLSTYFMVKARGQQSWATGPAVHSWRLSKHNTGRILRSPLDTVQSPSLFGASRPMARSQLCDRGHKVVLPRKQMGQYPRRITDSTGPMVLSGQGHSVSARRDRLHPLALLQQELWPVGRRDRPAAQRQSALVQRQLP